MCLVGVLDTAVVTTTNVNANNNSSSSTSNSLGKLVSSASSAASSPSSSSASPSGVKVESRPAFRSQIVVVDVNKPSRYVDSFCLQRAVVTCMTAVPGVFTSDALKVHRDLSSVDRHPNFCHLLLKELAVVAKSKSTMPGQSSRDGGSHRISKNPTSGTATPLSFGTEHQ
ncbi:unnamed protein product [Rodentolepis nana]|uniref:Ras-GEF domain-containing protein n=1 Tax=Rodentolepis nana TaxID=102285 RepID=A0A0R3T7T3_RODNA|nr:unnamed protein product [Rodentolepis nana]